MMIDRMSCGALVLHDAKIRAMVAALSRPQLQGRAPVHKPVDKCFT